MSDGCERLARLEAGSRWGRHAVVRAEPRPRASSSRTIRRHAWRTPEGEHEPAGRRDADAPLPHSVAVVGPGVARLSVEVGLVPCLSGGRSLRASSWGALHLAIQKRPGALGGDGVDAVPDELKPVTLVVDHRAHSGGGQPDDCRRPVDRPGFVMHEPRCAVTMLHTRPTRPSGLVARRAARHTPSPPTGSSRRVPASAADPSSVPQARRSAPHPLRGELRVRGVEPRYPTTHAEQ
jgi:hypothetical protein